MGSDRVKKEYRFILGFSIGFLILAGGYSAIVQKYDKEIIENSKKVVEEKKEIKSEVGDISYKYDKEKGVIKGKIENYEEEDGKSLINIKIKDKDGVLHSENTLNMEKLTTGETKEFEIKVGEIVSDYEIEVNIESL